MGSENLFTKKVCTPSTSLPGGLGDAGNLALAGQLPKTNATQVKIPHIAGLAAAAPATANYPSTKLGFNLTAVSLYYKCFSSHKIILLRS